MRVTRKMMDSNSVFNINNNKARLDKLNTQMATQKKYTNPSDDPITAVRSLRFRSNLSEVSQYLDRNATDAVSWTESTASAIDTAKELMRSLKAEYTSAANGTNETKDKWIYYENMVHLVNEYFDVGNTASEDRYLFTGYRTDHTLTFTAEDFEKRADTVKDGGFKYTGIDEHFEASDIESYTYTVHTDKSGKSISSGITDDEIESYSEDAIETKVENVSAFRMRLSYEELDDVQSASIKVEDPGKKVYSFGGVSTKISHLTKDSAAFLPEGGSGSGTAGLYSGDVYVLTGGENVWLASHHNDPKGLRSELLATAEAAAAEGKDEIEISGVKVKFEFKDTLTGVTPAADTLYLVRSTDTTSDFLGVLGPGAKADEIKAKNGSGGISFPADKDDSGAIESNTVVANTGFEIIHNDYEVNQSMLDSGAIYLNVTTGTFIFGDAVQKELQEFFSKGYDISVAYDKSSWNVGDAKPEYYFNCKDVGISSKAGEALEYDDYEQAMNYHVGDSQSIKVNTNACDVFILDARRDLEDLYDYLTALDNAQSKVDKINEMKADTDKYRGKEEALDYLLAAAEKELNYASEKVSYYMSRGMTMAGKYFDKVNLAATEIGTSSKRLELIKNRLTADKTTVNTQTSTNENVDLSTLAVDVNEASLLYSAALQVTGKIGQQSLVNYI